MSAINNIPFEAPGFSLMNLQPPLASSSPSVPDGDTSPIQQAQEPVEILFPP